VACAVPSSVAGIEWLVGIATSFVSEEQVNACVIKFCTIARLIDQAALIPSKAPNVWNSWGRTWSIEPVCS
jgi:hypothetical protein